MATTEPQKLPATILSRCQRFDFGRIPAHQIIERLHVALEEGQIQAEDAAQGFRDIYSKGGKMRRIYFPESLR